MNTFNEDMLYKLYFNEILEVNLTDSAHLVEFQNPHRDDSKISFDKEAFGLLLDQLNEIYGEMNERIELY